jgi:UDP-N-acetylmuramoylalanine--D-glutamate ligase
LENIAAAVQTAKCIGISENVIADTVRNFKGLEHRLEFVKEVDGVAYYNDSFATGPQPTIAAINSFTEEETLILGGSDKGLDFEELRKIIEEKDNVKNLILIGDIGEKIGGGIKNKNIINLGHVTMIQIIDTARKVTKPGGVVILSPAAASFDMFKNYKDRGEQFKKAVASLR